MAEEIRNESFLNMICPSCGSPNLGYSAKELKLACSHCSYTQEIEMGNDQIVERSLTRGLGEQKEEEKQGLGVETKAFHCNGCGANTAVPADTVSFNCPFCGSSNVNEDASATRVIEPAGVLPFRVPKKKAHESFKEWIGAGWFRPSNLQKFAKVENLQGVYLPFWTYDAETDSSWRAEAGHYYYVTETYTDSEGNSQTRQVQKVRWVPASGDFQHFFDDILVIASNGVKQTMAQRVYPFTLDQVVNYDSKFIMGWECELYQKDVEEGYSVANDIMDGYIRQQCASMIPGDTYRNLRVRTNKSQQTFKHILLPLWIAGYTYRDKVYQFVVNGETGKIAGKKPYSFWKIFFTVVLVIAIIAAIVYFASEGQNV